MGRGGRREIGAFNVRGELYGLPTYARTRRDPCARASRLWTLSSPGRRTTGGSSGSTAARSSSAPGTASSILCRPGDASPTRNINLRRYEVVAEAGKVTVLL